MDFYYINHKSNINVASIWISGGSDKDSNNKKGINQILSSLLIRGCKDFDNFRLSNYVDSYGAELNCETFEDGILLNIKGIKLYFKEVFPILNLIIESPILSKKQFKICQQNTINQIQKSKENPFKKAFENWRKLVYKNHPYAHDCNGYLENINNINHHDILEEYNDFMRREKVLLSNYYHQNMHNIDSLVSDKAFDKRLLKNERSLNISSEKWKVHYQNTNQLIIILGNKTCSNKNRDFINLKLLESYLAFGMSSKLFRVFRENNGLTYDAGVFYPLRKFSAPFVIYLSSSLNNCLDTFKQLIKLWHQLTNDVLSEKELDLAKVKLKASISLSSQTTEEIINRKVQLMGLNMDPNTDEELVKKISKVKANEVLETAQNYLSDPFLSISGNKYFCDQIKKSWQNEF